MSNVLIFRLPNFGLLSRTFSKVQKKRANDPKTNVMFAVNSNGTKMFFHAKNLPRKSGAKQRQRAIAVHNINFNGGAENTRAMTTKFGKFMR